jgi:hypothetical protein
MPFVAAILCLLYNKSQYIPFGGKKYGTPKKKDSRI